MANLQVASIIETINQTAHQFAFDENITFLARGKLMLCTCIGYLLAIMGLQKFMVKREPLKLKYIIALHNGFLSLCSLCLLALMVQELYPKFFKKGFYGSICDRDIMSNTMEFFCYLNYLLKYYELMDTFFLVVKKKDIPFLHTYHHTMTLILTHVELVGHVSVQWVPITLNLFVHVIMYFYYMLATFGFEIWWKKYLTSLQIIQFIIDLIACATAVYFFFTPYSCTGDLYYAAVGISIIGSYLFLFLDFFDKTYSKKSQPHHPPSSSPSTVPKPNPTKSKKPKDTKKKNQ